MCIQLERSLAVRLIFDIIAMQKQGVLGYDTVTTRREVLNFSLAPWRHHRYIPHKSECLITGELTEH
jgi:hypothetical protein